MDLQRGKEGEHAAGNPAVPPEANGTIGKYRILERIGSGGFGTVFKAWHRGWKVELAVKCPRPEAFQTKRQKQDFVAAAEQWSGLGFYPHIASCYYVRELADLPRLFVEFVSDGTLATWIRSRHTSIPLSTPTKPHSPR